MIEFYTSLHPVVQGVLKGLAVIMVIFPIGVVCSMAERKVSAWIQGRPGPNRAIVPWIAWVPLVGPFLQRLGRSRHAVGGTPIGRALPAIRDELVERAALLDAVNRGELDRIIIPDQPLDVLAQQIVADVASRERREDELSTLIRRASPYRNVSGEDF